MATIKAGLANQIANAQSVKSADGTMPVIIGEYGPSSSGLAGYDANGLQVVQAVDESGYGTMAWAWNAGTDTLTTNGNALTDFGQMVAQHIAAVPAPVAVGGTTPAPTPAPAPAPMPTPTSSDADTLSLSLSEDAWQGDAQCVVTIDGKTIGGAVTVTALHGQGESQSVTLTGQWGAGPHDVGVQFTNDAYGDSAATDRNLYVTGVTLDGQSAASPTATLGSNGTSHFATPASPLVLQLSEDAWQGDAQFTVAVDGKTLGAAQTVTALHANAASQNFAFAQEMTAGTHDIAVSFLNDAYGGTAATDRNLFVTAIDVNGTPISGGSASLMDASTYHFPVTVAAPV
jgi:hypothetical protein